MPLFTIDNSSIQVQGQNNSVVTLNGAGTLVPENSGLINVVDDFQWTLSPKESRADAPYIYMIERQLTNNVILQQFAYNIDAAFELGGNIDDSIRNYNGFIQKTGSNQKLIGKKNIEKKSKSKTPQSPYEGLYALKDTGWSYVLPYLEKSNHNVAHAWGDSKQTSLTKDISSAVGDALTDISSSINMVYSFLGTMTSGVTDSRVGTYIEQAKMFNYTNSGATYDVKFNLYNTVSIEDVIKNWEFCFLFLFQNLPNRRSKTIFDPPPLYEIEIPGIRRSPAAYIKGIQINFLGTTRLMKLNVGGQGLVTSIVPEAYEVNIGLEDVFPESKNFLQSVIDDNISISVSTNQSTERRLNLDPNDRANTSYNQITVIDLDTKSISQKVGLNKKFSLNGAINKVINTAKGAVGGVVNAVGGAAKSAGKAIKSISIPKK